MLNKSQMLVSVCTSMDREKPVSMGKKILRWMLSISKSTQVTNLELSQEDKQAQLPGILLNMNLYYRKD